MSYIDIFNKPKVYAAYKVAPATTRNIILWARRQGFNSVMRPNKMHVTTVYSRKSIPTYNISNRSITARFERFQIFPEKDNTNFGTLVAVLHSPALVDRWAASLCCGATYDYPEYIPHLSLARVSVKMDLAKLDLFTFPILLSHEYYTLPHKWGDKEGSSGYSETKDMMILSYF